MRVESGHCLLVGHLQHAIHFPELLARGTELRLKLLHISLSNSVVLLIVIVDDRHFPIGGVVDHFAVFAAGLRAGRCAATLPGAGHCSRHRTLIRQLLV